MRSMTSSTSIKGIAAIVGVGPKLGRSIARKFAHEGYTVAILARDLGRLSRFADEIAREEKAQVFAIRIDCSDSRSVREAFRRVLVYNAYQPAVSRQPTNFTDICIDSFVKSLAISSAGAFLCAQQVTKSLFIILADHEICYVGSVDGNTQVLPGMVERGRGTILFTGCSSSLNGIACLSELCKNCLLSVSQEFQSQGVHVAHVIIDGVIGPPIPRAPPNSQRTSSAGEQQQQQQQGVAGGETVMDPDSLAQTYWHLHVQGRPAWTQEIDLRPSNSTTPARFT
uniref:Uncharacterized protein n=1 Tax=Salix viminalis TaxID=40686 RepID=A0A6N2M4N4_SALVM